MDKAPGIALLSMVVFAAGCEFGQSFQLREWEAQLAEASSQVLASWLTGSNEDLHSICGTSPVAEEDLLIEEIRTAEPLTDYVNSIDVQPREGFGRIPNYLSLRCIRHRVQQGLDLPERYRTPDGSRDGVHGGAAGPKEDR